MAPEQQPANGGCGDRVLAALFSACLGSAHPFCVYTSLSLFSLISAAGTARVREYISIQTQKALWMKFLLKG